MGGGTSRPFNFRKIKILADIDDASPRALCCAHGLPNWRIGNSGLTQTSINWLLEPMHVYSTVQHKRNATRDWGIVARQGPLCL